MNRRRFFVASMSAAGVAACSSSGGGIVPSLMQRGAQALGGDGLPYVLNVEYAVRRYNNGKTLRGRTYNGGYHYAPVMETRPGSTLKIRVVNKLPPNPKVQQAPPQLVPRISSMMEQMELMNGRFRGPYMRADAVNEMNNPHDFNTTNLHVHGVQTIPHIFAPIGTSDPAAMMVAIEPGETFDYSFPIPGNHPSGLYWYHPHHHGSTDVQVSNGMAGLIIIRGPIDEVPEIAAAREIPMVVQTLDVNRSKTARNIYEREYIAYRSKENGGYFFSTDYTMITVNGEGRYWAHNNDDNGQPISYDPRDLEIPQYHLKPGEVVRLRFLNGTNYYTLPLVLPGFEAWLIERDGINLLESLNVDMSATGTVTQQNLLTVGALVASAGNRVELLLKAPTTPGKYTLSALANKGLYFREVPQLDLAEFIVENVTPVKMGIPKTLPTPEREYPLITEQDIKQKRTFVFASSEVPRSDLLFGVAFTVNGQIYKEMDCQTAPVVGTCEEWTIKNKHNEIHPFHLHENSFQVTAINGKPLDQVQMWDTFMVPPKVGGTAGSITIRVRFKQWYGKTVFHCHVLPHEDTGMMQNILMV